MTEGNPERRPGIPPASPAEIRQAVKDLDDGGWYIIHRDGHVVVRACNGPIVADCGALDDEDAQLRAWIICEAEGYFERNPEPSPKDFP